MIFNILGTMAFVIFTMAYSAAIIYFWFMKDYLIAFIVYAIATVIVGLAVEFVYESGRP